MVCTLGINSKEFKSHPTCLENKTISLEKPSCKKLEDGLLGTFYQSFLGRPSSPESGKRQLLLLQRASHDANLSVTWDAEQTNQRSASSSFSPFLSRLEPFPIVLLLYNDPCVLNIKWGGWFLLSLSSLIIKISVYLEPAYNLQLGWRHQTAAPRGDTVWPDMAKPLWIFWAFI